jgi:hypothetical protein
MVQLHLLELDRRQEIPIYLEQVLNVATFSIDLDGGTLAFFALNFFLFR